jgi:hypothetical protein
VAVPRIYFRLPPIIRRYDLWLIYFVVWAPYIAAYQALNRWPLRTPFTLPFTSADHLIPFVPALLPIYVAYLPFYFWTVARSENDREANRVFYGTHLQLLLSAPFFAFVPVAMPRELFYGPEIYGWADAFWRWFDAPNNCFPSLHASNTLLLMQFNWRRPLRAGHTVVGIAIILSAVLVKQHYVVDLVGGVFVYLAARWFLAHTAISDVSAAGWSLRRTPLSLERGQDVPQLRL